ncbi:erythroferrone-like [Scleropages formosus]|uniref:Adipolin n=1 Tax=Scleropages formosus TaxID=113540 RepID=A0A0P7U2F7_SCLFO|nr:erythroferrone-like [Scleropages formosus]
MWMMAYWHDNSMLMMWGISQDLLSSDITMVNPRVSWLLFRLNSNKGDNRRSKPQKKPPKLTGTANSQYLFLQHGLPGPPGPPGPQGPQGPPAPKLDQQEELLQELRLKLREVALGTGLLDAEGPHCVLCGPPPRISTAFHCRLLHSVLVPRRSLVELHPFSPPSDTENLFQRGRGFNSSSGRYSAPISGFYHLTASLTIEPSETQRRIAPRQRDRVKASICIESLCHSNWCLEAVGGPGPAGGVYSILLAGTLYLQAGEYISIFVDNGTGSALTVQKGTLFSGILLGV